MTVTPPGGGEREDRAQLADPAHLGRAGLGDVEGGQGVLQRPGAVRNGMRSGNVSMRSMTSASTPRMWPAPAVPVNPRGRGATLAV
jgi:hypothetical protein